LPLITRPTAESFQSRHVKWREIKGIISWRAAKTLSGIKRACLPTTKPRVTWGGKWEKENSVKDSLPIFTYYFTIQKWKVREKSKKGVFKCRGTKSGTYLN